MENSQNQPLNKRSLNVFIMLFSFILLPPSGIIIHSTHELMERTFIRHLAMSIHNIAAFLFAVTCVIHLVENRKAIVKYIRAKAGSMKYRKEAAFALIIVCGLITLFSLHTLLAR